MPSGDEVSVLLVEDDAVDAKAVQWALKKMDVTNPVHIARDGVEALDILPTLPRPVVIITDINMPRMNGIELLRQIRDSREFRHYPVFVLTTSNDDQDKQQAFNLHANGYMVKSDSRSSFTGPIEMVVNYWKVVELPT